MASQLRTAMITTTAPLLLLLLLFMKPDHVESKGDKVVCYYASWAHYRTGSARYTVDDIPVELCSHVIYAFAVLDSVSLKTVEHDSYLDKDDGLANYRRFVQLKQRNLQAKMLLGLGGWTDSRTNKYSSLVASSESRKAFTSHVISFLKDYGFDGLDLDWEYPAYQSSAADRKGFRLWVEELKAAFAPHDLLLTAAVSAGKNVIDRGYDVAAVAKALDQIHIMAYDFHGSWERQVAHHAPLFPAPGQSSEELSADFAVSYWIKKGAHPSKLVLGVPFYGRSWTLAGRDSTPGAAASGPGSPGRLMKDAGTLAYYEICLAHEKEGWSKVSSSAGPFLTNDNQWVGYDDIDAITRKTQYAKSKGLGGVMIWDIAMDDFRGSCNAGANPLLSTIYKVLGGTVTPRPIQPTPEPQPVQPTPKPQPTNPQPQSTTTSPVVTPATLGQIDFQECLEVGFTADPSSCSFFYRCLGKEMHHFQCPGGLYWNQNWKNCDWPSNSPCDV